MKNARSTLLLTLAVILFGTPRPCPASSEGPTIVSIRPYRVGGRLVCRVETADLPGTRAISSMQGGLPSAVDLVLDLMDERDKPLARREITFRLAFDLWEEIFRVNDGESENRFDDATGVEEYLALLENLDLASYYDLHSGETYRIRVGLFCHVIAPAQKNRISKWIAGEANGTSRDTDEREISFGMGSLIRFIFGGSVETEPPGCIAVSPWFRPEEVQDAPN